MLLVSTLRERNQQKLIIKHFFQHSLTTVKTLPGTELSHVALGFFQMTVNTSRTQGGVRWSKKHSYFPGTGKRHGPVVVSEWHSGNSGGTSKAIIVLISISLHRNTSNFSQVAGVKQSGCADALWGESQAADVTCVGTNKGF